MIPSDSIRAAAAAASNARHDHDGAADHHGGEHRDPADVGEQPERAQCHAIAAVAQHECQLQRPVEAAAVAVDDALGETRGAGAVDDVADILRADHRLRRRRRLRDAPRPEFLPRRSRTAMSEAQRCAHPRRARRQRIDARAVLAGGKHRTRRRVLDHAGDRRITDRDIEGHRHAARAQDAEQQQRELEAVVHEHRDAIAGRESRGGQSVGDLRGRALELRPASAGAAPR